MRAKNKEARLFVVECIRLYSVKETRLVAAYDQRDAIEMAKADRCVLSTCREFDNCSEPMNIEVEECKRGKK